MARLNKRGMRARLFDRPYLLLLISTLSWGGNAVAGRLAVGQISPAMLTAGRWGLVLGLIALAWRRPVAEGWPMMRGQWPAILAMGFAGYTAFGLLFYVGAHFTTAVNLSILQGSIPVLVMAGALVLHRTPIRPGQAAGLAVALVGVALVATNGDVGVLMGLRFNLGDLMMLAACALYAGYTLALRSRPAASGIAFFSGMAAAAFVTCLPAVAVEAWLGQFQAPTPRGWAVLAFAAVLPSFLAQIAFARSVTLIGPSRAGLFVNLVPVFGALMAVAILREPFGAHHAAAIGLVLAGIALAEHSARRAPAPA